MASRRLAVVFTLAIAVAGGAVLSRQTLTAATGAPAADDGAAAGGAAMETGTLLLQPQDTFLALDAINHSSLEVLRTYTWSDAQVANAILLKFDLGSVPPGAVVEDATLRLALIESDTETDTVYTITAHKIHGLDPVIAAATGYTADGVSSWTPNACCHDGVPMAQANISVPYDTRPVDKIPNDKLWTITAIVREWLAEPSSNFGVLLNPDASVKSGRYRFFASMEHPNGTLRPYLHVRYSLPTGDTTPPAVSLRAPKPDAVLSGPARLEANATDNVAVAGVQFFVDGAPFGSEVTSSPYALDWDTATFADGAHVVSAVARDAAGNAAAAAAVAVRTVNGTLRIPPEDTTLNIDDANYSTNPILSTYTWPDNRVANAVVLKFDLASVPEGAVIEDAALHLALVGSDAAPEGTYTIGAHKIVGRNPVIAAATGYSADGALAWTPSACCHNGTPMAQADISLAYDTRPVDKTPGYKTWTITSLVRDWIADPSGNFGVLLNSDVTARQDRYRYFGSMEHPDAAMRPFLQVRYSMPVDATAAATLDEESDAGLEAAAPTIDVTPTVVSPGGSVTVTIANGPGNTTDWVGLYATSADDLTKFDWKYLNGQRTAPATGVTGATLTFTMPATPGTYNLRFFANNGYTLLATSAAVTVEGPKISVSSTTVEPGTTVTATIANGPGYTTDWVGLYDTSADHLTKLDWKYLNGQRTAPAIGLTGANVTFTMPATSGTYNLRFFAKNGYTLLATSVTITVAGEPRVTVSPSAVEPGETVTVTVANGPGNTTDWVGLYDATAADTTHLDWKYLNGQRTAPSTGVIGATLTFTMPATPGSYNLRFFAKNGYTRLAASAAVAVGGPAVLVTPTAVLPGGSVTVKIVNGPANTTDWVGLYATGTPDDGSKFDWKYLNGQRTAPETGMTGATLTFTMPTAPGTYNLRFFAKNGLTLLATSVPVTVTGPTVSISPLSAAPGATVTATVANGPGNTTDWVGLYATGADDLTKFDWKYLNGQRTAPATGVTGATLTFTLPNTPGTYDLRFFLKNGYTLLAKSVAVTVQGDTDPPSVSITAPAAGTVVSGTTTVAANATDAVGVVGVQFKLDGVNLGSEDTTAPYSVSWNTASAANGAHSLTAIARDAAGNTTTSAAIGVTVANDTTAPSVSIGAPANGATVSGTVAVSATASDNVGVLGVQFKLNGANLGSEDTTAPYSVSWNTTTAANGAYTLTAVARDAAGNRSTSAAVGVTVANDTTAPSVSISAPAAGATVSGTITVAAAASDNVGVVGVQFKLDGANLGVEDTTAPYSASWATTSAVDGLHTLTAVARDAAGNTATAAAVGVTVSNSVITVSLQPQDTTLNIDSTNYSVRSTIDTYTWPDNRVANAMLFKFDLSGLPMGAVIKDATLQLALVGSDSTADATYTIAAHKIVGKNAVIAAATGYTADGVTAWTANTCCHNNVPLAQADIAAAYDTRTVDKTPGFKAWTLTGIVQEWQLDPLTNFGVLLNSDTSKLRDRYRSFASMEHADLTLRPSLRITYSLTPDATPPVISAITASGITASAATIAWTTNEPADSQVEYGPSTAYGSTSSRKASLVTSHTAALTGLAPATTYHYRVRSRDAAGNLAVSADGTFTTRADAAPVVSISAPAPGAAVAGTIVVSASATDDVGVAGVQFRLDGINLGAEDTTAPFSFSWDTKTAALGSHTLTAVARDSVGNKSTSSQVTVEVVQAILSWDPNTETDLAGYKVYIRKSGGTYGAGINVGTTTSYAIRTLESGTLYFFAVTAYDVDGNESALSTEVSTTIR